MKRSMLIVLLVGAVSIYSVARADSSVSVGSTSAEVPGTTTGAGESVASVNTSFDNFLKNTYFNYFAIYHGPSATNLGSPYTVDKNGKISNGPTSLGMYFDSEITAAVMITPNIGFGAVIPFLAVPTLGQGIILGDLGVKVFEKRLIDDPHLYISANMIFQGATSKASAARDMKVGWKSTPAIRYNFANSRFSVGSFNEIKYYQGVSYDKVFKLYADPYVNFILTPKLSLNVAYELEYHHNVNDRGYFNFTTYQTDIMPGFVYMVTPKILINPYLQVFTDQIVAMDHTAIGAVISASL